MLELLSKKYNANKKINNNTLEIDFDKRTLRIIVYSMRGLTQPLTMYVNLDISNYDKNIIDKLKIPFSCTQSDNKDWLCLSVGNNSIRPKTMKFLVKESENTIKEVIKQTDRYVEKITKANNGNRCTTH